MKTVRTLLHHINLIQYITFIKLNSTKFGKCDSISKSIQTAYFQNTPLQCRKLKSLLVGMKYLVFEIHGILQMNIRSLLVHGESCQLKSKVK